MMQLGRIRTMRTLLLFTLLAILQPVRAALVGGEYFLNVDPGHGEAIPLSGVSGDSFTGTITLNPATVESLTPGRHLLGVRFQDEEGEWGTTAYHSFTTPLAGTKLVAGEYFLNDDPGEGSGTSIAITEDGEPTSTIVLSPADLAGLPDGGHFMGVRFRDDSGQWGHPNFRFFTTPLMGGNPIVEMRWRLSQNGAELLSGSWTEDGGAVVESAQRLPAPPEALVDQKVGLELTPIDASGLAGTTSLHELDYRTFQEDFLNQHFTLAEQSDTDTSGDTADPDQDGLNNRVERALGLDPRLASNTEGEFTISRENLTLEFPVGAGAVVSTDGGFLELGDLRFQLMVSNDLEDWRPAIPEQDYGTTEVNPASSPLREMIHVPLVYKDEPGRFFRLLIEP